MVRLRVSGRHIPLVAAVCLLSFERVEGPSCPYLVLWTGALTACGGIALVICLTTPATPVPVLPPWGDRARLLGALLLAGFAVVSGWRLSDSAARVQTGRRICQRDPARPTRWSACSRTSPSGARLRHVEGGLADLGRRRGGPPENGRDARVNPYWLFVFGKELAPSGTGTSRGVPGQRLHPARSLPVKPQGSASSGGLTIRVFEPPHGYVSAAVCPPVS